MITEMGNGSKVKEENLVTHVSRARDRRDSLLDLANLDLLCVPDPRMTRGLRIAVADPYYVC